MELQDPSIGERIRRRRRLRGLSLDQAAGLAGISKSYLSRLERGERSLDSWRLLTQLATVLDTSITELTGQPYAPRDREHADAHRAVVGVRLALLDPEGPGVGGGSISGPIEALDDQVARSWALARDCDLVGQARLVPQLLQSIHRRVALDPTAESQQALALIAYDASFFMRNLGEMDLAWIAADRMQKACSELDSPLWSAMAAYAQAHALYPVGAWARASSVSGTAAQRTPVVRGQSTGAAARGSCLLVSSFANACAGNLDTARAQLEEAEEMASWLEEPNTVSSRTSFSGWNVLMHKIAVEVEAGDPASALDAAARINLAEVPNLERISYMWVDVGRAYIRLDRARDGINAFRKAERAAPLRVRLSPVVRESVRHLVDSAHRRASGPALRGLAERCGVMSA
jgi:transcriptional regulator with XRE-family HTH domain